MSINRSILYEKLAAFIDSRYHEADKARIKELCRIVIFNDPAKDCIYHSPPHAWSKLPRDKSLKSLCGYNALAADHKPDKTEKAAFISSVNS